MKYKISDLFGVNPENIEAIKEDLCYKTYHFDLSSIGISTYHVPMASNSKMEIRESIISSFEIIGKGQYGFKSTKYILKSDSFKSNNVSRLDHFLNDPYSNYHVYAPKNDSLYLVLLDLVPYWDSVYSLRLTKNIDFRENIHSVCGKILTEHGVFYCELYDKFINKSQP